MDVRPGDVLTGQAGGVFPRQHYVLDKVVGAGAYGVVYTAYRATCAAERPGANESGTLQPNGPCSMCATVHHEGPPLDKDAWKYDVVIKVVRPHPAYAAQAWIEVELLKQCQSVGHVSTTGQLAWQVPEDPKSNMVHMMDFFVHNGSPCIVVKKMEQTVLHLLERRQFRGLDAGWVKTVLRGTAGGLHQLSRLGLQHADCKPENVMIRFAPGQCPPYWDPAVPPPDSSACTSVRMIDLGSAGYDKALIGQAQRDAGGRNFYVQSRFYRAPEVLLGLPYDGAIDSWSLGCLAAEVLLGVPLFGGTDEHDVLVRQIALLGLPPEWMMAHGSQAHRFIVPAAPVRAAVGHGQALASVHPSPAVTDGTTVEVACRPKRGWDGSCAFRVVSREEWAASGGQAAWGKQTYAVSRLEELLLGYDEQSGLLAPLQDADKAGQVIQAGKGNLDGVVTRRMASDTPVIDAMSGPHGGASGQPFRLRLPAPKALAADPQALALRLSLIDLISRLLCFDPSERLTPGEVLLHPFLHDPAAPKDATALLVQEVQSIRDRRRKAWAGFTRPGPGPLVPPLGAYYGGDGAHSSPGSARLPAYSHDHRPRHKHHHGHHAEHGLAPHMQWPPRGQFEGRWSARDRSRTVDGREMWSPPGPPEQPWPGPGPGPGAFHEPYQPGGGGMHMGSGPGAMHVPQPQHAPVLDDGGVRSLTDRFSEFHVTNRSRHSASFSSGHGVARMHMPGPMALGIAPGVGAPVLQAAVLAERRGSGASPQPGPSPGLPLDGRSRRTSSFSSTYSGRGQPQWSPALPATPEREFNSSTVSPGTVVGFPSSGRQRNGSNGSSRLAPIPPTASAGLAGPGRPGSGSRHGHGKRHEQHS